MRRVGRREEMGWIAECVLVDVMGIAGVTDAVGVGVLRVYVVRR